MRQAMTAVRHAISPQHSHPPASLSCQRRPLLESKLEYCVRLQCYVVAMQKVRRLLIMKRLSCRAAFEWTMVSTCSLDRVAPSTRVVFQGQLASNGNHGKGLVDPDRAPDFWVFFHRHHRARRMVIATSAPSVCICPAASYPPRQGSFWLSSSELGSVTTNDKALGPRQRAQSGEGAATRRAYMKKRAFHARIDLECYP